MSSNSTPPAATEYAPYYGKYVSLVPTGDVVLTLGIQLEEALGLLQSIPEDRTMVRQPPYTWSIKEVMGHVMDAERVFSYRAMRFARGDTTPLAGFEQDDYVRNAHFDAYPWAGLIAEFEAIRKASISFYRNLGPAGWERRGNASGNDVSVRALAYIIAGHERHHTQILRKRVGVAQA
jgi:hypothetical protein